MTAYDPAFHHGSPHGLLAAVHLPGARPGTAAPPVPPQVLARLHPEERTLAEGLRGHRAVSFVGGRLAVRSACRQLGLQPSAVGLGDRGEPVFPKGLVGSISHKADLAVALVAPDRGSTLGVDLEDYGPARFGIAQRVLRPEERAAVDALPDDRRWMGILLRFSIKESIYKALHPHVRRFVAFEEASVTPGLDGDAVAALHLAGGEGPFDLDVRFDWLHGRLVTSARVRPA